MNPPRSLKNDGAWIAASQVLAALGQVIGVRLLTELLSPTEFGVITLWMGGVALVASGLANPTMQALLRFYPEYESHGQAGLVRIVARKQMLLLCAWISPFALAIGIFSIYKEWATWPVLCLVGLLSGIEMIRMQNIAVLNAVRLQRLFGLWQVLEAWLRPILAVCLILLCGAQTVWVLVAFLVASTIIWLGMRTYVPRNEVKLDLLDSEVVGRRFWKYTIPILPLAIFGWISGMADRYIIAGMMTAADVGMYAAVYSLASRPMMMLSTTIESTIRPVLQKAIIENQMDLASSYIRKWVIAALAGSALAIFVTYFMHDLIAILLLGSEFRSASFLLPWLVFGHFFLIMYHVFGRVLFATDNSAKAVSAEIIGAVVAISLLLILVGRFGLIGAVAAVIFGYLAQFFVAYIFSLKTNIRVIGNGNKEF